MRRCGFSLLELMMVVALIALLISISVPVYSKYLIKTRVVELLSVANSYKTELVENIFAADIDNHIVYELNDRLIERVTIKTLDVSPAKFVIEVVAKMKTPQQLGIGLTQQNNADPLILQLHGTEINDIIRWSCHVAAEYNDYMPGNCRNNELEVLS